MKPIKTVLVVTDGRDYSIKEVSEWLLYYCTKEGVQLIVLNVLSNNLEIRRGIINSNSDLTFGISDCDIEFKLSSVIGVFIRQVSLRINGHSGVTANPGKSTDITSRTSNYLMAYEATIRGFILDVFSEKNIIGYDSGSIINKLEVLKVAAEIGLKMPLTTLVSNKTDLINFYHEQEKGIITKSVGINMMFFDLENNLRFNQLTHLIYNKDFEKIPETFPLSFVQQKIEKEFEIRTFFLDGFCYSWALLSQSNEKTQVDYRNYDWDNPMRVVPFELPMLEQKKIKSLMKKLRLRTGSIDLIYSTSGEYIFLEVNPAGQYGYNSDTGNNYLDKKIAEALIFKNEKKKHRISHS